MRFSWSRHNSSRNSNPFWTSAAARARAVGATCTVTPRGALVAAALGMFALSAAPIATPTSAWSLQLANGADAVELERDDAFALHVRRVAMRVGVRDPDRLSVRVGSDETAGVALGANAWIQRCGACIVVPFELYESFYATPAQRQVLDLPTAAELDFVLAHESAHIAANHAVATAAFLPLSMLASCSVAMRMRHAPLAASAVGCVALVVANTLLSWRIEHAADHVAADCGFATGGIACFERRRVRNCALRLQLDRSRRFFITADGDYLGDTAHPLLTWRIRHLESIAAAAMAPPLPLPLAVEVVDTDAADEAVDAVAAAAAGCRYCLRV